MIECSYLPVDGLGITVPDEYVHISFRPVFTAIVAQCAISSRKDMEESTPGDGFLVPFAFNLMNRALTDEVLFSNLKQASNSIQHWFFNDFLVIPHQSGKLVFAENQVKKTISIKEDFLELIKSIGEIQLANLQNRLLRPGDLATQRDWGIYREGLVEQIGQLQRTNFHLSQYQVIRQGY